MKISNQNNTKRETGSKKIKNFYEVQTKRKVPIKFDIHHIDFNPNNNDILNLVALPVKLHRQYHSKLNEYYLPKNYFQPDPGWQHIISTAEIDLVIWQASNMRDIYGKFCNWYNFRNSLLGILDYVIQEERY